MRSGQLFTCIATTPAHAAAAAAAAGRVDTFLHSVATFAPSTALIKKNEDIILLITSLYIKILLDIDFFSGNPFSIGSEGSMIVVIIRHTQLQ
jgi:hypothetical protein